MTGDRVEDKISWTVIRSIFVISGTNKALEPPLTDWFTTAWGEYVVMKHGVNLSLLVSVELEDGMELKEIFVISDRRSE